MKTVGHFTFPESRDEAPVWRKTTDYRCLGGRDSEGRAILAVATTRVEGKWMAYIGIVPGKNFDDEYQEVLRFGSPLSKAIAKILFPRFANVPYHRS